MKVLILQNGPFRIIYKYIQYYWTMIRDVSVTLNVAAGKCDLIFINLDIIYV